MKFKPINAQPYSRLSRTSVFANGGEIVVSSDLFDEVFADKHPEGNRQKDSRFPEVAETDLNAMTEGSQNSLCVSMYLTSGV